MIQIYKLISQYITKFIRKWYLNEPWIIECDGLTHVANKNKTGIKNIINPSRATIQTRRK